MNFFFFKKIAFDPNGFRRGMLEKPKKNNAFFRPFENNHHVHVLSATMTNVVSDVRRRGGKLLLTSHVTPCCYARLLHANARAIVAARKKAKINRFIRFSNRSHQNKTVQYKIDRRDVKRIVQQPWRANDGGGSIRNDESPKGVPTARTTTMRIINV